MVPTYEKIAPFYKYYIKELNKAAAYYMKSAKLHEENQNYRAAFKKAFFAIGCLEEINKKLLK